MKSIGNNYLKASIRKAAKKKPRTCSETSNPESSIKRYTNYIPDLRQQREQHGNNLGDLFAREINSIKKIM